MNNMSAYLREKIMNESLSGAYIALYITDPTDTDRGTEVNDSNYVRQPASFSPPVSANGETYSINTSRIVFPIVHEDAGYVTHIGIRNSSTGGNLLYPAAVFELINLQAGMGAKFEIGQIRVTLR